MAAVIIVPGFVSHANSIAVPPIATNVTSNLETDRSLSAAYRSFPDRLLQSSFISGCNQAHEMPLLRV
jgi:hypothetical protein